MSQSQIDHLKRTVEAMGLVLNEDYYISGNGGSLTFSIDLELDPLESVVLPEVLRPYAMSEDNAYRAIDKGADKQTVPGVIFAGALSDYSHHRLRKDPECIALEATLKSIVNIEDFRAYEAKRQLIWERIWTDPELLALQKDLDENYL